MLERHRDAAAHGQVSLRAAKSQWIPCRTALDGFDGRFAGATVAAFEEQALELSARGLVAPLKHSLLKGTPVGVGYANTQPKEMADEPAL